MSAHEEEPIKSPDGTTDPATAHYDAAVVARARAVLYEQPEQIGSYRILERLGGGGMGEVFRAEQRAPIRRDVALKLIKLGMDTKLVIARFEAERQALAMMDHPHIAKVFDAGTEETGRPYFIMEYVKGRPITDYADQNHLSIEERLELFGQICNAVQHAHHKGIIHRDLKPSNVLVSTQDGKPFAKVIDFGIAKATAQRLTDLTLYTQHEQLLGTPQYMSPEQAEGSLDIDTRTDVYSLGVLLYELLTGSTPFGMSDVRAAAIEQLKRMICEVDPPKPSTRISMSQQTLPTLASSRRTEPKKLGTLVRGELDWIVMKSLEKDRARRYDTPTSFAEDVKRYLTGQPVVAAPPSWAYRSRKFVRRYKGPVLAALAIATILMLGIAGTVWQASVAIREKNNAQVASVREAARADSEAKARDAADFESYIANISAAQSSLTSDNYAEARERLDACPDARRGWEWKFLARRAENVVGTLPPGHELVGFTPDGTRMAVLIDNQIVQWRDIAGRPIGEPMVTRKGSEWHQVWAKLSQDGSRVATASADGFIGLWDDSGRPIHPPVETGRRCRGSIEFSPDGTKFLAHDGDLVSVWNVSGELLGGPTKIENSSRHVHHFTDDSNRVVTYYALPNGATAGERLWDLSMKPISPLIGSATFNRDGSRILDFDEGVVRLLNSDGTEIAKLVLDNEKWQSPDFNVDGTLVLTQSKRVGCLWDRDGKLVGEPMKFGRIGQLEFSPTGKRIVSQDETSGKIQVWDGHARHVADLGRNQHYFWFSPDGQRIVTSNKCIRIWDADGHPVCDPFPNPCDSGYEANFEISPDNSRLVVIESDDYQRAYRMWLYDLSGRNLGTWFDGSPFQDRSWYELEESSLEQMFAPGGKHVVIQRKDAPWLVVSVDNFSPPIEYFENDPEQKWMIDAEGISIGSKEARSDGTANKLKPHITKDGDIELGDAASPGGVCRIDGHHRDIGQAIVDARGTRVVTAGEQVDPSLRFWDIASKRQVANFSAFALTWEEVKVASSDDETSTSRGVRTIRSGAGSIEFAADDRQLVLTAFDPHNRWQAQSWDIRDAAERQHDRDARREERLALKEWARRHLQVLLSRQRAAKPVGERYVDPWRDYCRSEREDPANLAKVLLEQDRSLSPVQRAAIFDATCVQLDEMNATNLAVWEVVGRADSSAEAVKHAVEQAKGLCETIPSEVYLQSLAVAQYRAGKSRDAQETFRRRDAIFRDYSDDKDPYALAGRVFLAMATYQAGDAEAARAILDRVNEVREKKGLLYKQHADIFREAEALIKPGANVPAKSTGASVEDNTEKK